MTAVVFTAAVFLAFVNGANDNMKGVATLIGAGIVDYRRGLLLATVSTALGALLSVWFAARLVSAFSAKGLLPDAALTPALLTAVAVAATLTVLAATRLGLPVSTTHALLGGLVGAGLVAAGTELNLAALGAVFALPLLAGPVLAVGLANVMYRMGRSVQRRFGVEKTSCVCVGEEWVPAVSLNAAALAGQLSVRLGTTAECQTRYVGRLIGVSAQTLITGGHLLSAGLVGFARGLNDTPKIVGLVVGATAISPQSTAVALSAAMALGGILAARRVTETMARRITPMTPAQGLVGNLATSLLVIGASPMGLPVSTTHVSVGGIFGIGSATGNMAWRTVGGILSAWVTTLPVAAVIGGSVMWVLS